MTKKAKHTNNHDETAGGNGQSALWINQFETTADQGQTNNQRHISSRAQRLDLPERSAVRDEFDQ